MSEVVASTIIYESGSRPSLPTPMTLFTVSSSKGRTQPPAATFFLIGWLQLLLSFGGHPPLLAHGFGLGHPRLTSRSTSIGRSFASLRTLRRQVSCSENDILSRCDDDYDDNDDGVVAPILIRHQQQPPYHTVQGLECVAVTIGWPRILLSQQHQRHNQSNTSNTTVTIVEATARSQAVLVDQALEHDSLAPRDSDVYGAVVWPAALVLAERLVLWILLKQSQSSPSLTTKPPLKILEVGAGTGLVSLAAWRLGGGAHNTVVLATDYHDLPLQLLQYAAQHLNHADDNNNNNNPVSTSQLHTAHLDLCDYRNTPLPWPPSDNNDTDNDFTIMVAADVLYEPATGVALAHRAVEALARGMHVWIADSPGRAGRTALLQTLHELLLLSDDDDDTPLPSIAFTNVTGWTVTGERHELICGPHSSSVTRNSNNNDDATATPQPLDVALLQLDPAHYRNVAVVSQSLSTHTLPKQLQAMIQP
jgi:predicted nicotinamide N-methyase